MHEVAILVNDDPKLGKNAGALITIDAVENAYQSSAAAKVNRYKCANENCGVNVIAVIPQKNKLGRIKSPCSYFSAKPISHIDGCSRQPLDSDTNKIPSKSQPVANPIRRTAPTIWVDPTKTTQSKGMGGSGGESKGSFGNGNSPSQSIGSGGTSEARSQLVRRFASEWMLMSVHERQNTPLTASWNIGGSYFSGFFPIRYYPKIDATTRGECIVVGVLSRIYKGTTGYILTLKEKDLSGLDLKIWIQNVAFDKGSPGNSLRDELIGIENDPKTHEGREVFAFGQFRKQHSSNAGSRSWMSLPIVHPSMIWISNQMGKSH